MRVLRAGLARVLQRSTIDALVKRMAQKFNADLVDDVARRRIVLFVGAGASKWSAPNDGSTYKDWPEFLRFANSKVKNTALRKIIATQVKSLDYLMASELLKKSLQEEWISLLSQEFQKAAEVSRLHHALINLYPRIIITTNFDKLLENAWNQGEVERYPTVISKVDSSAFKLFRNDENYLLKIHGSVDNPDGIVFDKTSYQRDAYSNRNYVHLLSTLLLTHTFIFVGFSMADPAVSLIVEGSAFRFPETRPHYMFQPGKSVPQVDDLWKQVRKLYVLRYSPVDEHLALAVHLEALGVAATTRRTELAAGTLSTVAR